MNDNLPSKQFLIRGGIAVGIVAIVLIVQTNWFHNLFHSTKKTATTPSSLTIGDEVLKDSNGNGIPDWQEVLWGLDPTVLYTNGKSNAEIIKEKKAALGITDPTAGTPTNETDAIAQQLFSITTALSQNQDVDDATLQNIATQLGSSVNIAAISNKYSLSNIHTVPTSVKSLTAYSASVSTIMSKVDTSEEDIPVIVQAAETGDYSQLPQLTQTGTTYTALAKQLSTLNVPLGVAQYHLDIINSFAGMAASFTYLQQMEDDSTQALVGVALYKVYNARGEAAFTDLHTYLTKYGILSS
jgi:hypothetical protein